MAQTRVHHWITGLTLTGIVTFGSIFVPGCSGEYFTFSQQSRAKGVTYLEANQYDEAQGAFRDAVRQNPRDYESYYYLGTIYDRQKQYANAIASFKTSLQVQDVTTEGQKDLASRLKTIDAFGKTVAKADERDVEVNRLEQSAAASKTGDEYFILARIYVERGDADSAVTSYAKAAQKSPEKFYIFKEQGLYLEKQQMKAEAEGALRKAYRLNDQDVDIQQALRRLGVVPGPAIKEANELAKPIMPKGPIPEIGGSDRPKTPAPLPGPSNNNPAD